MMLIYFPSYAKREASSPPRRRSSTCYYPTRWRQMLRDWEGRNPSGPSHGCAHPPCPSRLACRQGMSFLSSSWIGYSATANIFSWKPRVFDMLGAFFGAPYRDWWLSCAANPQRISPYNNHWLVRSSTARALERGLVGLHRQQQSMIEVSL